MKELKYNAQRMSNIELLRVISMLMVVTLHYVGRGGIVSSAPVLGLTWSIASIIDGLAIISVNVYILISGYFLIKSSFKFQKLIDIVIQVFSYSFLLYLLFVFLGKNQFSVSGFIKSIIPLLTNQYWFATAYVALYILFPFMNKGLIAMSQKQHRNLCLILVLLFSLYLPSVSLGQNGTSIVWVMSLYVFGAYLRLYYSPDHKINFIKIMLYVVPAVLLPLSKFGIAIVSKCINPSLLVYCGWFYKYNSILVLWASIAFFVIFLNLKINNQRFSRFICFVGSLTFGVYLLHNNPSLRDHLWNMLDLPSIMNNWWFIFLSAGIILVIFIISSVVEFVRQYTYLRITRSKLYNNIYQKIVTSKIAKHINDKN